MRMEDTKRLSTLLEGSPRFYPDLGKNSSSCYLLMTGVRDKSQLCDSSMSSLSSMLANITEKDHDIRWIVPSSIKEPNKERMGVESGVSATRLCPSDYFPFEPRSPDPCCSRLHFLFGRKQRQLSNIFTSARYSDLKDETPWNR
jgi:hypothetical protein